MHRIEERRLKPYMICNIDNVASPIIFPSLIMNHGSTWRLQSHTLRNRDKTYINVGICNPRDG